MNISYSSADKVILKIKNDSVTLGDGVKIGDYQVTGAGEYDIANIQCEAKALEKALLYFVRAEDLTITFLSDVDTSVIKVDEASKTDILIVDVRSNAEAADLKNILKQLEPGYLFLIGSGNSPELVKSLGLPSYESSTLKVTRSSLPQEGSYFVPQS